MTTIQHFVEEYYTHPVSGFWWVRRRCLTDPGLQRSWFLQGDGMEVQQIPTETPVEAHCIIRYVRYILQDKSKIDLCAYEERGRYTRYFIDNIPPGEIITANKILAFIDGKTMSECPEIFPIDLRNTTPMHWVPLDKPLPESLDPGRKRCLPLKLTV